MISKKQFVVDNFRGGLNTRDSDNTIANNELSGGQNIGINPNGALVKRKGCALYGNVMGITTGVLGLFEFVNSASTQVNLAVYNTDLYYYNAGVWTSLTQTLTTNLPADGAYNPFTDKFYITNGTDNVVVVTSSASVATDASFKKGNYIIYYQDRLITANVTGNADVVWYTDAGVDTFSANNYFTTEGAITGLETLTDMFLVFTRNKIYKVRNFIFDGVANSQPNSRAEIPTVFGAIYDRTIQKVNNLIYFLAQDHENKTKVMVTNGFTVQDISDKISTTLAGYAANQSVACAGVFGDKYVIALKSSGGTTNDRVLIYDTKLRRWLPEYTGWTPSCFMTAQTSNQPTLYWGDSTTGTVYTAETGDFDELIKTSYSTGSDSGQAITGLTTIRAAQSFQISATQDLTQVGLYLKKNAGTTTELTIRIETDTAGVPSGTLANASATTTITAFADTSYVWKKASFTAFELTADTTYWIVAQHTTEGSGTSSYVWGSDASSPTYTLGSVANYASSTWTADATSDAWFMVFTKGDINGYADTKAFDLGEATRDKKLYKGFLLTDSPGDWNIEWSWTNNLFTGYNTNLLSIAPSSALTWGGGDTWGGDKIWGGSANRKKHEICYPVASSKGQQFKFRIQNKYANETFTLYQITIYYYISNLIK